MSSTLCVCRGGDIFTETLLSARRASPPFKTRAKGSLTRRQAEPPVGRWPTTPLKRGAGKRSVVSHRDRRGALCRGDPRHRVAAWGSPPATSVRSAQTYATGGGGEGGSRARPGRETTRERPTGGWLHEWGAEALNLPSLPRTLGPNEAGAQRLPEGNHESFGAQNTLSRAR